VLIYTMRTMHLYDKGIDGFVRELMGSGAGGYKDANRPIRYLDP